MQLPRVLVIFNEPVLPVDHPDSAQEHDVLDSTALIVKILQQAGFPLRQLGFSYEPRRLLDELRDHPPDVVFNMFEGLATHTATEISVVSLLEWLNVPFTGSPSFALGLGRDKIRTKHLLHGAGVATPDFQVIEQLPVQPWPHAFPAIVKPACQDASVGIDQASVVRNQGELEQRVACMLERYGPPVLIEEFINGREFHANLIEEPLAGAKGTRIRSMPLAEIGYSYPPGTNYWPIYSYDAKWSPQTDEFRGTSMKAAIDLAPERLDRIERLAEHVFKLVGMRDCGRIDLRLAGNGTPYVLEVNPNPYLHGEAIVDGLKAMGRSHSQFIEGLVWNAYGRGKSPISRTEA
jgi:D-alanine-D-alanine ligase